MPSSDVRSTGKLKMVNQDKGFGFIRIDGQPDLFFHVSECLQRDSFKGMQQGMTVSFAIGVGKKGTEGRDVELVVEITD